MLKKHTISVKHAWDGVLWVLRTQPNYRVHIVLSLIALFGCWWFSVTRLELLIILVLITGGLTVETINTALEEATDAIDTKIREDIKIAKDVAAAAMLIYAVGSLLIACVIFIPRVFY